MTEADGPNDCQGMTVPGGSTGTAADGGAGGPEVHRAGAVPAAGPGDGGHVSTTAGRSGGREASQAGRGDGPQAAGTVSQQFTHLPYCTSLARLHRSIGTKC